jgi:hypothetical protein
LNYDVELFVLPDCKIIGDFINGKLHTKLKSEIKSGSYAIATVLPSDMMQMAYRNKNSLMVLPYDLIEKENNLSNFIEIDKIDVCYKRNVVIILLIDFIYLLLLVIIVIINFKWLRHNVIIDIILTLIIFANLYFIFLHIKEAIELLFSIYMF